jgi:hypothetical protein
VRKRISLKTRRPDLSRREFRQHYEQEHVPLGLQFIDHFRWRRYLRNHVVSVTGIPIGFDCYAEFWVDEDFDDRSLEVFIRSPDFGVLNEDDRRFLDTSKRLAFDVGEHPLVAGPDEAGAATKVAIIWKNGSESSDEEEFVSERIIDSLGDRIVSAVLDKVNGAIPPNAPFDRLLTLGIRDEDPIVLDQVVRPDGGASVIVVDPIETALECLEGDDAQ